ncbi:SemiSWEET transporter [Roseivirga sp. UBA1976]|uniref:SemiSWEET family sugar transporter n=1 Tax=Roseivirga sp. UBA1976 TaxID=1947386 RepID=UPI00257F66A5|nr:SemiSWEET transporter [Roseivirga sp. UBA1976]MEC7753158.1 SemiSWEET transporter [Bacteroidota bacterium]
MNYSTFGQFLRYTRVMENLGILAAILTTGAFLPQAIKTIRTRHTEDLSLTTFAMMFLGTLCWLAYGLSIDNRPLIIANIITALLAGIILFMKLLSYRKPRD